MVLKLVTILEAGVVRNVAGCTGAAVLGQGFVINEFLDSAAGTAVVYQDTAACC